MFELRCSEFELFCSESTGQPQDQETRLAREQAGLENPPLSCCEESKAYITVRCSCSGKIMHVGRVLCAHLCTRRQARFDLLKSDECLWWLLPQRGVPIALHFRLARDLDLPSRSTVRSYG